MDTSRATSPAFRVIGLAGSVAGVLDITSAFVLAYPKGVGPIRVLQGVAAGLLGRESAIQGGLATAVLGLAIHFFIAFVAASVFYLASRKIAWLTRQAVISGFLYGIAICHVLDRHASRLPCRASVRLARCDRCVRAHVFDRVTDCARGPSLFEKTIG
jgi:hypothetical protein